MSQSGLSLQVIIGLLLFKQLALQTVRLTLLC